MSEDFNEMLNVKTEPKDVHEGSKSPSDPSSSFWAFHTMITPALIQVFFWIGSVGCIIAGLRDLTSAYSPNALGSIAYIILGPLALRVACEFTIVFFRMNETLTAIKGRLKQS